MPGHAPGSEMDAAVEAAPIVFVVDDEEHMGTALRRLFVSAGLATEVYATGEAFLARPGLDVPGCVVLDVCPTGQARRGLGSDTVQPLNGV